MIEIAGMVNFGIVTPGLLCRSGRYRLYGLKEVIKLYGIKRVVDLRDREPLFKHGSYHRIGVEFISYPLSEYKGLPVEALSVFDGVTPTLVHCWKGAHRTGAWVARYRLRQGWSFSEIADEMDAYGFGRIDKHRILYESIALPSWSKSK